MVFRWTANFSTRIVNSVNHKLSQTIRVLLCLCILSLSACYATHTYVFQLNKTPGILTQELAVEKARESMSKAGFNLAQWHLRIGTGFEQFGQTNWGRFHFTDGRENRCVQVRLEGDRLICEVVQLP